MYKKVETGMDFCARELQVLDFWKQNDIAKKSMAPQPDKPPFSFFDGPPTANGMPHIGHLITRSFKDLVPRYKRMRGYDVLRKAGWDTHGLPVELEVEKLLGLDGKEQIEEYGVEPFIQKCKESVWKYKGEWEQMSDRIAFWADMDHPYVTYENDYIESEWWSLKQIYEKGLLYKGHKVVPYCPRCGTALSSHEVAQGYKDVKERSATAKFKCCDEDAYYLAWTTTPWTLASNVCLCVNGNVTYCRAKKEGVVYILAKDLVASVLGEENVEIVDEFPGSALVGRSYEPLFDCTVNALNGQKAHVVIADDYVTTTDGTGIVHNAPAFGEDDYRVCKENNLPFVQMVDPEGKMCGGTPWDGLFVKDADPKIIETLEAEGKLYDAPEFEHSYPFCWRCDTPLLYYARSTWFIKMSAVRDQLVKNTKSVNWLPENIRDGRMGNFVENVIDWGLSRERYWGTPLPVWTCECGHIHVIGSRQELRDMGADIPDDLELHKPFIDKVTFPCPKCGKPMHRVPEVIDCWYDSGSMPFAQFHYPFENKELFERFFPAQFISEAIDQTRGWFYTLLAISTLIFDKASYENCLVLGHVQDKDGQKMSKHKGNVISPWEAMNKQGSDAVRWYFYTGSAPWLPSRFYDEAVSESQRKFMGTLWNTYAFYILYAEIDQFDPHDASWPAPAYTCMDRWVQSKLQSLVQFVTTELDQYHITEAARAIAGFVDELSNWYVRRSRDRFWGGERTADKSAAYRTLYQVLETLTRICAPFVPFMTESMYQNLVRSVDSSAPESVHLTTWPDVNVAAIDKDLEAQMETALQLVVLGRSARNAAKVKNRQPLSRMLVQGAEPLSDEVQSIILDELNVKAFELADDAASYVGYLVKPQMKTLGPKYGKLLPKIGNHLKNGDGNAIVSAVADGGLYKFEIDGQKIALSADDLLIEATQKEGFATAQDYGMTVALDLTMTPALLEEGLLRETVSKIQTMRKERFEVTDRIHIVYQAEEALSQVWERHADRIMKEVLAVSMELGDAASGQAWEINGQKAQILLTKADV
ncbi:MAG: isoleucine--tRNA ligase [Christensenellales bacterium]